MPLSEQNKKKAAEAFVGLVDEAHALTMAHDASREALSIATIKASNVGTALTHFGNTMLGFGALLIKLSNEKDPIVEPPSSGPKMFDWSKFPLYPDPIPPRAPATMHVWPGKLEVVGPMPTMVTITTEQDGTPLRNPLAAALRIARDLDVIEVHGEVPGFSAGGPMSPAWANANVKIPRVTIQGDGSIEDPPTIRGIVALCGNSLNYPSTQGWQSITFRDLHFITDSGDRCCIQVTEDAHGGLLEVLKCSFESGSPESYSGYGMQFVIRCEGQCRLHVQDCEFCSAREHMIYADNLQGDSVIAANVWDRSQRTRVQITQRSHAPSKPWLTHARSFGHLLICGNVDNGAEYFGDGGAAYTVAGHLGPVTIARNDSLPGGVETYGALAVWVDLERSADGSFTKGEPAVDADGFAVGPVRLIFNEFDHPKSSRTLMMVSACRELTVEVRDLLVCPNNKAHLHINHEPHSAADAKYVKPIGALRWSGPWQAGLRVKVGPENVDQPFQPEGAAKALLNFV